MDIYIAYIPIDKYFEQEWIDFETILKEISNSNLQLIFKKFDIELGYISLQITKEIPIDFCDLSKGTHETEDYKIKYETNVDKDKLLQLEQVNGQESIDFLLLQRICNSIIVFNIAKPGLFHTGKGVLFKNGVKIHTIDRIFHRIELAMERNKEIKWPKIELLDLKQVWNWYFSNEKGIDELSTNPLERSLNAFSYLFNSSIDFRFDEIFWALVALEALYCKGIYNLQGQLSEKTEIYLGKREEFKKEVSRMYDFRSKFVHGVLNIPNRFLYDDLSDNFYKFQGIEYSNAVDLAITILIATFQKLIKTNKFDIDFELKLKE